MSLLRGFVALVFSLTTCSAFACSPFSLVRLNPQVQSGLADAAIGQVVYSTFGSLSTLSGKKQDLLCYTAPSTQDTLMITGRIHGDATPSRTWATSVSGVGIRIAFVLVKPGYSPELHWLPYNGAISLRPGESPTSDNIWLKIELVKTGAIARSGTIHFQQPSLLTFKQAEHIFTTAFIFNGATAPDSCHFSSPATHIVLIPVSKTDLDANTYSEVTPFSLDMLCSSDAVKPELTLFGPVARGQRDTLIASPGENMARGVGVQLLFNAQPLDVGKPLPLSDLSHRDGKWTVQLAARYHRTGEITPGTVETHLTLKINYL